MEEEVEEEEVEGAMAEASARAASPSYPPSFSLYYSAHAASRCVCPAHLLRSRSRTLLAQPQPNKQTNNPSPISPLLPTHPHPPPSLLYQDELLASSLELLLASPLPFVRGKLTQMVSVIELSLSMGHAYPPLSTAALSAIERLQLRMPTELRPLLPSILPSLHGYLTVTSEASTQATGKLRKERDARRHTSKADRRALMNSARSRLKRSAEDVLQQRIVTLLGSVGGDAVTLVHGSRTAPPAEGRWEVAPRVGFDLPLTQEQVPTPLHSPLTPRHSPLTPLTTHHPPPTHPPPPLTPTRTYTYI